MPAPGDPKNTRAHSAFAIARRWSLIVTLLALTVLVGLGASDLDDPDAEFDEAGLTVRPALRTAAHRVAPEGFAYVRAGTFVMGSPSREVERQPWNSDEERHWVTLSRDLFVQETEVTQALWTATVQPVVPDYKPSFRFFRCGLDCPAESMTWYQAVAFANLYSAQRGDVPRCYKNPDGDDYNWADALAERAVTWPEGPACAGFRLPTEAEWEYAARGTGPVAQLATYARDDSEAELGEIAWYVNNSSADGHGIDCTTWDWKSNDQITTCGPQPVAGRRPNNRGLYDVIGNVWEWTWDNYGTYPRARTTDPTGPETGNTRAIRGGSWYVHKDSCRVASRSDHEAAGSNGNLGLRLVQTALP